MAHDCLNWAWRIRGLRTNEKLLLVCIADRSLKNGVCQSTPRELARDLGWSLQQLNRVLKRLVAYGLIEIGRLRPGSEDFTRQLKLKNVDPDWAQEFQLSEGQGRPTASRIMSTSRIAFWKDLASEFNKTAENADFYQEWIAPLKLIEIRGHFLIGKVPNPKFAAKIEEFKDKIVKVAQVTLLPKITDIRTFPRRQRQPKTQK